MNRRDKTNYYLDMAQVALERGTCLRRNFGAVIVKNDVIVSTGYTGAPRGRANCIDIGTCMVTVALASLLIGGVFLGRKKLPLRIFGMVLGAFVFRLVYTVALRFDMPAFMLKLVSAVVVVAAISIPYLKEQYPLFRRRIEHRMGRRRTGC